MNGREDITEGTLQHTPTQNLLLMSIIKSFCWCNSTCKKQKQLVPIINSN